MRLRIFRDITFSQWTKHPTNASTSPSEPIVNPLRVLSRFLIGYLLLHLVTATVFVSISSRSIRHQMVENTKGEMNSLALMLQAHLKELPEGLQDDNLLPYVLKLGQQTDYRYTVIDTDGNVLADSEKGDQDIGLHLDRPEVIQARNCLLYTSPSPRDS